MSGCGGYIRCWTCNGNGSVVVPQIGCWGLAQCPDCRGTGVDEKNTKEFRIQKLKTLKNVTEEVSSHEQMCKKT